VFLSFLPFIFFHRLLSSFLYFYNLFFLHFLFVSSFSLSLLLFLRSLSPYFLSFVFHIVSFPSLLLHISVSTEQISFCGD
jgi:hypothetical protein